jgi:hypothetical protein
LGSFEVLDGAVLVLTGAQMTFPARTARTAVSAWEALRGELHAWEEAGRVATLWWRDDDATRVSPELERLVALGGGTPLALAVIPANAESFDLSVTVLQHGWAHVDNAPPGERKCELVGEGIVERLIAGKEKLERLFGSRFLPVMVPPWNRIDAALAARLPALGYHGLSTLGPRRRAFSTNVHVDVMDWPSRRFAGTERALGPLVEHLRQRRLGKVDADEPTGIMTHHRVHGDDVARFLERLFEATKAHPATRWLAASEIFARP